MAKNPLLGFDPRQDHDRDMLISKLQAIDAIAQGLPPTQEYGFFDPLVCETEGGWKCITMSGIESVATRFSHDLNSMERRETPLGIITKKLEKIGPPGTSVTIVVEGILTHRQSFTVKKMHNGYLDIGPVIISLLKYNATDNTKISVSDNQNNSYGTFSYARIRDSHNYNFTVAPHTDLIIKIHAFEDLGDALKQTQSILNHSVIPSLRTITSQAENQRQDLNNFRKEIDSKFIATKQEPSTSIPVPTRIEAREVFARKPEGLSDIFMGDSLPSQKEITNFDGEKLSDKTCFLNWVKHKIKTSGGTVKVIPQDAIATKPPLRNYMRANNWDAPEGLEVILMSDGSLVGLAPVNFFSIP